MEKKKILFIEDEIFRNEAMYTMLSFDYEVDWAVSPKEALDKIKLYTYDLILLDIILPVDKSLDSEEELKCNNGDNTGLVLAEKFLKTEMSKNIPIIFVSARNHIDTTNLTNVKHSIVKPFYYAELKKIISSFI